MDYVRRDSRTGKYREQDIMSISQCLIPIEDPRQAFWEQSARMYLAAMIGYVLECLLPEEHTLAYAAELFSEMPSGNCNRLFRELGELSPDSFAYKKRRMFSGIKTAEKMYESIQGILAEKPDHRLPVPVRFILDGFATNVYIPGFDKILLVIRSREICASVIVQSVAQLEALYGAARAEVIIDNCDNCLYLGRQDVTTARYISVRANRTVVFILNLPLGEACLFTRGQPPETVLRWAFELASPRPLTAEPAAAPLQLRGGTALLHLKKPLPSGDFPYRSLQRAGAFSSIYGGIYRRRRAENARWRKSKYTRSPPEFSLHISSVQYFYKPAGKTIAAKQEGGAAA